MTINLINSSSAHFGSVRLVIFDSSNEKLISIGEDEGRLYVWNADTLSPSTGSTIENETENYSVRSAVFPDDFTLIFGGDNNNLTQTDWPNCNNYAIFLKSQNEIDFVSSKWDTNTIAYSDEHTIRFFDKENTTYPELHIENSIKWLNFSRNAKYLAVSSNDSTIIIWDASNFTEIFRKKYDLGSSHPSWGPGDFLLIPISSSPGTVIIISVDTLEEHQVQNPSDDISTTTEIALSNNFMLAIADDSKQISFLQLNEDYSLTPFSITKYSGSELTTLSFGSMNTHLVAAGDTEGTLFLFELVENKKAQINPLEITLENNEEQNSIKDDHIKEVEDSNKSKSSLKTINDILKDKPNAAVLKPRTQTKKAKGKGKQQKLVLAKAPTPTKSKKIESTRHFVSDNSSSSSSDNEDGIIKEPKKTSFLNDSDGNLDDFDNIEEAAKPKPSKSFLNDEDAEIDNFEDIENQASKQQNQSNQNSKKSFLSDDNDDLGDITISSEQTNKTVLIEETPIIKDDGIPGYDDIALPDDDDDIDNILNSENEKDGKEKEESKIEKESLNKTMQDTSNTLSYLDCSLSTRFMPGSFKQTNGNSEILCWNGEGSIVMYNQGGADTDKYVEICPYGNSTFLSKRIDEAYEITLGTIDEYGYLIATNNTVIYHRHNEDGPESEIIKTLPFLEDIQLIACGSSFFAVATARKFLHIFSSAGFELSVITLNGRIITMVGHENYLFIVSGKHHFDLFDVFNRTLLASGVLPIHSPLRWAGFNHYDHSVLVQGGNHQLLTLSYSEGARWTPVLDLSSHLESSLKGLLPLFIVEVYGNQVSGAYLDKESDELETNPFPETLKEIDFEPPTIESLIDNCVLSIVNYQNSIDTEKEAKRFDRDLLIKFDAALKEEKLLLGYQIAEQMKTTLGLKLAIQICDQKGQSGLSERLIQLKDLKNEEEEYDESDEFGIDESTEEPMPFVRTEQFHQEDEEERIQKTNIFLDRFNSSELQKETTNNNESNTDKDESDEETNNKIKETESSEDDLDKPDDSFEKVSHSNSESKEIQKKTNQRKIKEKQKQTTKSKNKSASKSRNKSDIDDDDDDINQKQSDTEKESDEDERKEKKKSETNKNEKKKPKSTRKKLFNRRDKPSNMSALDAFGFS